MSALEEVPERLLARRRGYHLMTLGQWRSRELRFLECLAAGRTLQEIAVRENLSLAQVNRVMRRLREKMGARTNAQAVAMAVRRREIE